MGFSTANPSTISFGFTDLEVTIGARTIISKSSALFPTGKISAIIGQNGAGKSTFLKVLAGIKTPTTGIVKLDNHNLQQLKSRTRARLLAYVGQETVLPSEMTVAEYVSLSQIHQQSIVQKTSAAAKFRSRRALAQFEVVNLSNKLGNQLSGGQIRRVQLARAFAQDTPIIILDEPTNHLDLQYQHQLLQLLRNSGKTVLMAQHNLDLVVAYCDWVLVITGGMITKCGPPKAILTPQLLNEQFRVCGSIVSQGTWNTDHLVIDGLA